MKPRVRINQRGFTIALPGYGVDDGERFLMFSPNSIALPIYMRGTVMRSGGTIDTGAPPPFNNGYERMTVPLGKTFPAPPIVLFQAKWQGRNAYYMPTRAIILGVIYQNSQRTAFKPVFVQVTTTQVMFWNNLANLESFSYLVLENTLT